jgi:glycosyltransferase involved in cell wall biosynthesis
MGSDLELQPDSSWLTHEASSRRTVLMLLSNCFNPDPRVYAEAHALLKSGYEVVVLGWDREHKRPAREVIEGIEVERIHLSSSHNRGATQAFYALAVNFVMLKRGLGHAFDVVHGHDFDTLPAAYLLGWLKRKPVVYDSHEDYAGMLHGVVPIWIQRCIRWVETRLVRRVNLLITVGEKLRRDFETRGCGRAIVVGNWKHRQDFQISDEERLRVRRQLDIPEPALLVCYIGQLDFDRKIPELLEAVAVRSKVHLIIGGAGSELKAVQDFASRHCNIHFVGYVDVAGLQRYTAASDVIYYGIDTESPNSQYSAPNKLFEALAAGKAVISGHFGEVEQIVTSTRCGILVDSFSVQEIVQALDLCSDPGLLREWQENAARAGEKIYTWDRAAEGLTESYATLFPSTGALGAQIASSTRGT